MGYKRQTGKVDREMNMVREEKEKVCKQKPQGNLWLLYFNHSFLVEHY